MRYLFYHCKDTPLCLTSPPSSPQLLRVSRNPYSFTVTEDVELVANFEEGVGIVETDNYPSLRVYPNPTDGVLNLIQEQIDCGRDAINRVSTITGIEVFDVMGRMVTPLNPPEGGRLPSFGGVGGGNISHLPNGVYFLKIQTETGVVVRKVVKN